MPMIAIARFSRRFAPLLVVVLLVSGCASRGDARADAPSVTTTAPPATQRDPAEGLPRASAYPPVDPATWAAIKWPAGISGVYGASDTSAYDGFAGSLAEFPSIKQDVDRRALAFSYVDFPSMEAIANNSNLVVRGRPLAFSRPYFNSLDGSFWHHALLDDQLGMAVPHEVLRDVLFEVTEVMGGTPPETAKAGVIEFTVRGGQIAVDIPADKADGHVLKAGLHVFSQRPEVDLEIGEDVVLFLRYGGVSGLYADDGKRFGWIERITPAHQLFYKFTISDGVAINAYSQEMRADINEISQIVGRSDFDGDLTPPLDGKVHELQPSDTHNDAPAVP